MIERLKSDPGVFVTLVGSALNVFLVALKFVAGTMGRSTALIADAVHSLSDLLNDVVVVSAYRIGRIPRDENHPYGHGRAETIGATLIGVAIILVGTDMAYEVWKIVAGGVTRVPSWITAVVAAVSMVSKEIMYRYTRRVGEKIHSPAIVANAWDQRSDALSSVAALTGIVGAINGFPIMDPLAGGLVALMIAYSGYKVLRAGLRDLMDSALGGKEIQKIERIVRSVPGVVHSHDLRARRIGGEILIDVHVLVDPRISVTEGHNIAETARRELMRSLGNVQDVLVHVDPEDDSAVEALYTVSREELERLTAPIIAGAEGVRDGARLRVHYLKGKNVMEIFVKIDKDKSVAEAAKIVEDLKTRLKQVDSIDDVQIFLDVNPD